MGKEDTTRTGPVKGKVKRRPRGIRFSDTEWSELEHAAVETGYGSIGEYVRDRLFTYRETDEASSPSVAVPIPEELQWRMLAAILHHHKLLEEGYTRNGMGGEFEEMMRKVEGELTLARRPR